MRGFYRAERGAVARIRGILARSMSQENVEAFRRAVDAYNRRDIDAFLEDFDPEVEWRPLTQVMFGGDLTVYRGHHGIRRFMRDVDEALAEVQIEDAEIRDLGDRLVVTGRLRARGKASGAETESPIGWVVEFKHGKVTRMRDYADPKDALEAVGVRE
jgi:ketosteroid isomerase-like protein